MHCLNEILFSMYSMASTLHIIILMVGIVTSLFELSLAVTKCRNCLIPINIGIPCVTETAAGFRMYFSKSLSNPFAYVALLAITCGFTENILNSLSMLLRKSLVISLSASSSTTSWICSTEITQLLIRCSRRPSVATIALHLFSLRRSSDMSRPPITLIALKPEM